MTDLERSASDDNNRYMRLLRVLEEQRLLFERITQANRRLETKAAFLLLLGSVLFCLALFLDESSRGALLSTIAYLSLVILLFRASLPVDKMLPFNTDIDVIFRLHINVSDWSHGRQTLSNYIDAANAAIAQNRTRSKQVRLGTLFIIGQILLVLFASLYPV